MASAKAIPRFIAAESKEDLMRAIAELQLKLYGKVAIIAIYYDSGLKEHVCWYLPPYGNSQVGGL